MHDTIETDLLEKRVREIYRDAVTERFKPVREPSRIVALLREKYRLVVDERKVRLVVASFLIGRPVLFEGPPGTGKTEIGEALLTLWAGKPAFVIPCSENYNEYRVLGDFHPLMAMKYGFNEESFIPRPLLAAMVLDSGVLVDEIRRSSDEFQNLLLDIIDKRRIIIPELKRVVRSRGTGFQIIFTSNPEDYAQGELSDAFLRRIVRISFDYPPPEVEEEIIRIRYDASAKVSDDLLRGAIKVINFLRERVSLYRPGPADTVMWIRVAGRLAELRGSPVVERQDLVEAATIVLYKRVGEEEIIDRAVKELL